MTIRTIAIDWSGAATSAARTTWLAEAEGGQLVRLERGRGRAEIAEHLLAEAQRTPAMIVGLDFAFSMPAWFLEQQGLDDGPALWNVVACDGERWLASCESPFWGRPGRRRPAHQEEFRRTDRDVPSVSGIRPKSVFQVGGAGSVGSGSLRGMPFLRQLRNAGFAIWPFDAPRWPMVVEIYPRLLTGPVHKGRAEARVDYLRHRHPALDGDMHRRAASSEDAFDAAVSALAMDAAREELKGLPTLHDTYSRREGRIWDPSVVARP